ncbi:MAG: gamma-glutamylcyclotransferase [Dehalococcoidia bacterium]|nr:gamma-glutamylcyclotransferase [Dehalococcoidia bacterium]
MFYFAYASNLSRKQMASRAPGAKASCSATLPNHKIIFTGWSRSWKGATASLQQSHGDRVSGGLYEVSNQDLEKLAKCEGTEYTTRQITVFRDTGETVEAVAFVRRQQAEEGNPSPEYLAIIKQGYADWSLL